MDRLSLFGLLAVTLMLVFYALENRSPWFILAPPPPPPLSLARWPRLLYGFLQGAWPFGLVEAIWAGVAFWRWWCAEEVSGCLKLLRRVGFGPAPFFFASSASMPVASRHRGR